LTSFDWSVLTAGLAAALGGGFVAMTALRRRRTRRHTEFAQIGSESGPRRIEVVAIDDANVEPMAAPSKGSEKR
jgi:hypothetical protein